MIMTRCRFCSLQPGSQPQKVLPALSRFSDKAAGCCTAGNQGPCDPATLGGCVDAGQPCWSFLPNLPISVSGHGFLSVIRQLNPNCLPPHTRRPIRLARDNNNNSNHKCRCLQLFIQRPCPESPKWRVYRLSSRSLMRSSSKSCLVGSGS